MAVIKSGILGGVSGSIGNVTGSSWKGIAVLRTKPLSVANPNTPAQQAVRTPWSALTKLASSITGSVIQPVWNGIASKMSGYNLFLQKNAQKAFDSLGAFVPADLLVSPGTLAKTTITNTGITSATSINLAWSTVLPSVQALATDKAYAAAFDADGMLVGVLSGAGTRSGGHYNLIFNRTLVDGEIISVYLFFFSVDGKRIFAQDHKDLEVVL